MQAQACDGGKKGIQFLEHYQNIGPQLLLKNTVPK
jgi:hypothetical protein